MQHTTETPKQYQCRHIFTDGHRCASLNLPKPQPTHRNARLEPIETVEEITIDPTLGIRDHTTQKHRRSTTRAHDAERRSSRRATTHHHPQSFKPQRNLVS
jgi:hypothetical protein